MAKRQADVKRGADARLTFYADRSAQQLRQSFDQWQAEPGALNRGLEFALYLHELLEDSLLVFCRDADAGIGNMEGDQPAVCQLGGYANIAATSELQRIRDQVAQDLGNFALVRVKGRKVCVGFENQIQTVAGQERFQHAAHCAEEIVHLKVSRFHIDLARFHLGEVKQVIHQFAEFGSGPLDVDDLL